VFSPLSLAPPLTPGERIAELERHVADLERTVLAQGSRLTALAARVGQQGAPLRQYSAQRRAAGARLRAAIGSILAAHPGSGEMTAKDVLRALERGALRPLPALRTVRWHLQALRGNGNAAALPPR
jgi:DNA-binding transcriptional ArsR family regulator